VYPVSLSPDISGNKTKEATEYLVRGGKKILEIIRVL
jgi:hypothetical protein